MAAAMKQAFSDSVPTIGSKTAAARPLTLPNGLSFSKPDEFDYRVYLPNLQSESHFVSRISYGPTPELLTQVQQLGWETVLEQQLDPDSIDDQGLEQLLLQELPTLSMSNIEILADQEARQQAAVELIVATLIRRFYSPRQLFERMVEFWTDHFNVSIFDGAVRYLKTTEDREVIRPLALGRFRDLLHANARSPAMLYYLDNYSNSKQGPNENYSRELMELHTLGVDGGYTEQDVIEVARALTGWGISRRTGNFAFRFLDHDLGEKTVLGATIPAGGGIGDGNTVLDMLADHPATARFICRKIARRFVSDNPPESLVDQLAQTFSDSDGDIREIMRTLFASQVFWNAQGQKLKRPQDLLASTIRTLGLELNDRTLQYTFRQLEALGQVPFGWPAPNGFPDSGNYWTNTGAMIGRWNIAQQLSSALPEEDLEERLETAATATDLITILADTLMLEPLNDQDLESITLNLFGTINGDWPIPAEEKVIYARITLAILMSSRHFQSR